MVNVEPLPNSDWNVIVPKCFSTIVLTIERPILIPPFFENGLYQRYKNDQKYALGLLQEFQFPYQQT